MGHAATRVPRPLAVRRPMVVFVHPSSFVMRIDPSWMIVRRRRTSGSRCGAAFLGSNVRLTFAEVHDRGGRFCSVTCRAFVLDERGARGRRKRVDPATMVDEGGAVMKHDRSSTERPKGQRSTRDLAIHEVRVLTGDGDVRTERTVECEPRGLAVDVAACVACGDGRGEVDDGQGRALFRCSQAARRDAPPRRELPEKTVSGLGLLTPVAEVMTPCVLCVRNDVDVASIITLLEEHRISAVPVVDGRGRPIGILSKSDLLREMRLRQPGIDEDVRLREGDVVYAPGSGFHVDSLGRLTAEDVMTKVVIWLPPQAPIASAAAVMAAERLHRVVVVSDDRKIIGVVSSLDLLAWMAREAGLADRV